MMQHYEAKFVKRRADAFRRITLDRMLDIQL